MNAVIGVEPLENRTHFAAFAGLDPTYIFGEPDVARQVGHDVDFYQAVPAAGDRTYLLAEKFLNDDVRPPGELMIVAVGANRKLDPSFGVNGIALTGRRVLPHESYDAPGILKLGPGGRLYFADNQRVLRFRPNGKIDLTFGKRGAITHSPTSPSVALCDIAFTDDNGVLVATTHVTHGVERYDVYKAAGRDIGRVWSAEHDTGIESDNADGTQSFGDTGVSADNQVLHSDRAQFAQSRGGLVLLHVESDQEVYTSHLEGDPVTATGTIRSDLVVTRFDTAGHGTDLARREMRRSGEHVGASLGDAAGFGVRRLDPAAVLSANGRVLIVQTDEQFLRLDLRRNAIHRFELPAGDPFTNPRFRLLPDGHIWVFDDQYVEPRYYSIQRFALDGTPDGFFDSGGALLISPRDSSEGNYEGLEQLFLGASGRLYIQLSGQVSQGGEFDHGSLTIRRV